MGCKPAWCRVAFWRQHHSRGATIPCSLFVFIPSEMYTKFNHVNSLSLIARAHQLVQEGYKYMFDEALATVWSAPNYCYRCGNMAAILTIREDGTRGFTVYGPAEENERDVAQQRTRRVVRCVFIQRNRLCVLTWGLSKGEYAVLCVDQCRPRIDFTVSCILSRPLRSNALSRSAGSLAICLPTIISNPYGVRVTSPTSAKYFPCKHGRSCRHFQATSRFTSSHNTKGLSYSRGPIVSCSASRWIGSALGAIKPISGF